MKVTDVKEYRQLKRLISWLTQDGRLEWYRGSKYDLDYKVVCRGQLIVLVRHGEEFPFMLVYEGATASDPYMRFPKDFSLFWLRWKVRRQIKNSEQMARRKIIQQDARVLVNKWRTEGK